MSRTAAALEDRQVYGIDLGTTCSTIAVFDELTGKPHVIPNAEGDLATPSVVLFEDDHTRVVGKEAQNAAIIEPGNVVQMVKRHLGVPDWRWIHRGQEYTAEEIASCIILKMVEDAEVHNGFRPQDAIMTCPANFSIQQREALAMAGRIAGINVLAIINEPTAAALFYGLHGVRDELALIYHLGGGTFNVSIIEVTDGSVSVVATGGDDQLGGRDWDEEIVRYLSREWMRHTGAAEDPSSSAETLQKLWRRAEDAKRSLTARGETRIAVRHERQPVIVTLTRAKFDELTRHLMESTISLSRDIIAATSRLDHDEINRFVLVGGSTRMPQVPERLWQEFGQRLLIREPDLAAAKGAAIYGQKFLAEREIITEPYASPPSEPARPNFFRILDLDPAAKWDDDVFNRALHAKRSQWARQRISGLRTHPDTVEARRNLALIQMIERVMRDPEAREVEQNQAHRANEIERRRQNYHLAWQLDLLLAKGFLYDVEYEDLKGKVLADAPALRWRLEDAARRPSAEARTDNKRLDRALERTLQANLDILAQSDLYAVLHQVDASITSTSPPQALIAAADKLYQKARNTADKSRPEVAARQQLAGIARQIFTSDEMLRQHNVSMLLAPLDAILAKYEQALAPTRTVSLTQFEMFLREAAAKGIDADLAQNQFAEYFKERHWPIEETLALLTSCPNCGTQNSAHSETCARCGYPYSPAGIPAVQRKVFISYVREDAAAIDRIATALRDNGIDTWLDRTHIAPGERWQLAIQNAIRKGNFFIACFSSAYAQRDKTYMNEELRLAIEQLRLMPLNSRWFIPIILEPSEIPDFSIDATTTLLGLQYIDFTDDWHNAMARLIHAVCSDPSR